MWLSCTTTTLAPASRMTGQRHAHESLSLVNSVESNAITNGAEVLRDKLLCQTFYQTVSLHGLLLLQRSVLDLGMWLGNNFLSGVAVSRWSTMHYSLTQCVRWWLTVNCLSTSVMWWLKVTLTQALSKRLALSHYISSHQQKQSEAPWHCLSTCAPEMWWLKL